MKNTDIILQIKNKDYLERLELFGLIKSIFCDECGFEHQTTTSECQCWNDE